MDDAQASLAILAGGEGSRMGMPKGQLQIRGRHVLAHLLDQFRWTGPKLLVTAPGRERPPGWELFDSEVSDPVAAQGPLRGLATALEHARSDVLVVATVDMPNMTQAHLQWLVSQLMDRQDQAGVMISRASSQVEPFPSAYRRSLALPVVLQQLAGSRRSVIGLASLPRFAALSAPPWAEDVWLNLNEPCDLDRVS
jgi:molybdopterin-guanine dinucleotide biosynthesis protein A